MAGNGNIDFFCLECYTDKSEVNTLQTEVIKIDRENMDLDALKRAGEILKSGGLVAFPTETVYGLGGDGLHEESSRKIYEAKGRPSDNPLIVHVADMEHLEKIVKKVPKAAYKLAEAFWPGPMTMILEKNDLVPYGTTGGLDTVAIRMPSDPIALELIRQGGGYIAAPSANTSGRPSPTTAQHVYEDLQGKIPMILDGGAVTIGLESTIVDLTEEIPTILRPGFISLDMVQAVLGEAQIDRGLIANDSNIHPKAPGICWICFWRSYLSGLRRGDADAVLLYACAENAAPAAAAEGDVLICGAHGGDGGGRLCGVLPHAAGGDAPDRRGTGRLPGH